MSVQALRRVPVICHTMKQPLMQMKFGTAPGAEARPHPAPHRAAGSRRAITGSRIGVGEALKPAIPGAGQHQGADEVRDALG